MAQPHPPGYPQYVDAEWLNNTLAFLWRARQYGTYRYYQWSCKAWKEGAD